jgi:lipopolysaccharide/colanic/teichoic acid biosynthesis glycosyltransferase
VQRAIPYWLVCPDGNRSPAYQTCKRLLDVVAASIVLVLLAPVMLATLAVLTVTTRGKPIFRQTRVGECGRKFTLYKFRTMVAAAESLQRHVENEKDGPVFKNRRDPRITRLGAFLRKFSIDEMPQLFNVIRGEMSLVGPRPPIESEVQKYEIWQLRRLAVKPGLTCLWQVSGRCEIGFLQWVRMDLWYIDRQSLLLDLILLAKTPWCVITGRGAY